MDSTIFTRLTNIQSRSEINNVLRGLSIEEVYGEINKATIFLNSEVEKYIECNRTASAITSLTRLTILEDYLDSIEIKFIIQDERGLVYE